MFHCQLCNCSVAANQPANFIVSEKRDTTYEVKGVKRKRDRIVNGWEIIKEIKVCPECYEKHTGQEAKKSILKETIKEFAARPRRKQDNWKPKKRNNFNDKKPIVEIVKSLV